MKYLILKIRKKKVDWSMDIKKLLKKPIEFLYTYDFPEAPPEKIINIEFMQLVNDDYKKSFLNSRIYSWFIETLQNSNNEFTSFGWFSKKAHNTIINVPSPKRKDVKSLLQNLIMWVKKYSDHIEIKTHNKTESYIIKEKS